VDGAPRQHFESDDDQRVAGQHRPALAEGGMHRRLATPRGRVVEAGQVVVHQRSAVHEFDRGSGALRQQRVRVAAGGSHRQAQQGPRARAAGQRGGRAGGAGASRLLVTCLCKSV
jgi:hypothetical protein